MRSLISGRFLIASKHNFSSASWMIMTCLSMFFLSSVNVWTTTICSAIVFVSVYNCSFAAGYHVNISALDHWRTRFAINAIE